MPRGALHGRSPISGLDTGLDEGSAEAYADELLLHFGLDDDDDLGDEDDLDDEDDLEDDLDDEDDLDAIFGSDDELEPGDDEDEGFGGAEAWPSRVFSADRQRFGAFHPLGGLTKTIGAASNFASQAGQGLSASGFQVFAPPPPIVLVDTPLPSPPFPSASPVVADRQSLPPVYVADPSLAAQAEKAPAVESKAVMAPSTKFGASFREGSVRPRSGGDKAAIVAGKLLSEKELRRSEAGKPTAFAEDGNARPVLHQDGTLHDAVHGRLALVPCMSCGELPQGRYGSSGSGCLVCEDYGAILVPTSDLPNLVSVERFGFVAALLTAAASLAAPAGQLAGGAVGQRKQQAAQDTAARAQKIYDRLRKQVVDKAAADSSKAPASQEAPSPTLTEKVSGMGGDLGDLDDLEDLDLPEDDDVDGTDELDGEDEDEVDSGFEEAIDEEFGADDDLDDDLDDDDDDGEDDSSPDGRIVRILFPRGRFDR